MQDFFYFIEMIKYCRNRLFPDGVPTKSMLAVTRDDFVTAGEVMAMSVVQGGPSQTSLLVKFTMWSVDLLTLRN